MRKYLLPVLPLLALGATTASAQNALPDTPLTLRAAYSMQNDSNLFRLPSGAALPAGKSSMAEQISLTTVGVNFATTQSLQRFELDASVVDNHYQNYDYLSFTATNYAAAWRWALTPRLTGNLTAARQETLNSFADFQGFNQRNKRTETANRLDALYELTGPWRLVAGLSQGESRNEQTVVATSDSDSTGADLGLRYVFSSGSTMDVGGRATSGNYRNLTVPNASLSDDSFKQTDAFVKLHWNFSGVTVLDATLSQANRSHPNYSQRDYSGLNANAVLSWAISGKTRIRAEYARELAVYATANSNYTQTDRLALGGSWAISPKTLLSLSYTAAQIDYQGSPSGVGSQRRDQTTDTALTFSWEPVQRLNLAAALENQTRSASLPNLGYDAVVTSVSARYSF